MSSVIADTILHAVMAFAGSLSYQFQRPEGTIPLMLGGERWGTRLEDGTIVGAPGVTFTPLPVCSRCQQEIDRASTAEVEGGGSSGAVPRPQPPSAGAAAASLSDLGSGVSFFKPGRGA